MYSYPSNGFERVLPFVIGVLENHTAAPASLRDSAFEPSDRLLPNFPSAQVLVLRTTKKALHRDLQRAVNFDQSHLFKLVHDNIFGVPAPTPFALLLSDFEFDSTPADLDLLTRLSSVASAIEAPFIAAASPALFLADSWEELRSRPTPAKIFEAPHFAKWRSIREGDDARYLGLTIPPTSPSTFPLDTVPEPDQFARLGFISNYPASVCHFEHSNLALRLAISRVAQYAKAFACDNRFHSHLQCVEALNHWIARYVSDSGPLTSAHVSLSGNRAIIRALPAGPLSEGLQVAPRAILTLPQFD